MPYIAFDEYTKLYDRIDEQLFDRLVIEASRVMDIHTTGIDNVKKLKTYFPTEEDDAAAVRHCAANLVYALYQIHQAEATALESRGYEATEQGMRGKIISSISAGNESISYATGGNTSVTAYDAAAKNRNARAKLLAGIVWDYLRGVSDANGVGLLYMGMYPRWRL